MPTFTMFGPQHWWALAIFTLIGIILIMIGRRNRDPRLDIFLRYFIAGILWFFLISMRLVRWWDGSFTLVRHLPIHLCGFSSILIPLLLFNKNQKLFDTLYFWGVGGATQSLLTPTLQDGFPSYYFYEFFSTHFFTIFGVLYLVFIDGLRPSMKGLFRTYWITCLMLIPIGITNWLLGSNYFFIAHKPATASLLDFMGPWPLYLLPLSLVALIIFTVVYLPFPIVKLIRRRTG